MNFRATVLLGVLVLTLSLTGCGSDEIPGQTELFDKQLNEIMAAKSPFAFGKGDVPILNTHDWDMIFGGNDGSALKYDRYGEVDELVFVALPKTPFNLQRQIRKKTRLGPETIYYKVTTPVYQGDQELWVDGRFLSLQELRTPPEGEELPTAAKTLITLRGYEGIPYTWRGSSETGIPEILEFYPPTTDLTERSRSDWILRGFDSLGMLYRASGGATPLDLKTLARFGDPVFVDTSEITNLDVNGNTVDATISKAKKIMSGLRPLDIISFSDRVWVVLDQSEVIESRYRSKFDGSVQITSLYDTLVGLLQKGAYVRDSFDELENANVKKFYIRRFADTGTLMVDQLMEDEEVDTLTDDTSDASLDDIPEVSSEE